MNELVSVWYMDMPPTKQNLNRTWALLFPIHCTSTRESSKDICAAFDKGSMAMQLIFQKPTGSSSCLCWKLSFRLKVMRLQRRESTERRGKCSHPSDTEDECHALFTKFSGGPLLGRDEGTGGLLNSSGIGWFPRKARCHSPY